MFYNNFGKRGPIFKILSPVNWFAGKFSDVYTLQRFPSHLQQIITLFCEIRKSKNVTEFSRWTWQLICLTKIYCENFTVLKWRVQYTGAKITMVKKHHDATRFNWTTFNCWFETSSDKLQNASQSMSAVLRQSDSLLLNIKSTPQCPQEHVNSL